MTRKKRAPLLVPTINALYLEKVEITIGGHKTSVTAAEAIVLRVRSLASRSDPVAIKLFSRLAKHSGIEALTAQDLLPFDRTGALEKFEAMLDKAAPEDDSEDYV